jgi:hypothetical protein
MRSSIAVRSRVERCYAEGMRSWWKTAILVIAIVLAVVAAWHVTRGEPRVAEERAAVTQKVDPRGDGPRSDAESVPQKKVERRARVSRAERDAVYRRIIDGLARRDGSGAASVDDAPPTEQVDTPTKAPREKIRNRLGDTDGWGDAMSDLLTNDFGPLADECIADARDRAPDLAGMAAIEFTVVADEDIGGVVESADAAPDNEIDDAGFVECMRESMLSTVLPPPPGSGRREVVLSLRLEEE